MKIIIAGGNGFLGRELQNYFTHKGFETWILTRNPKQVNDIKWDAQTLGEWTKIIENSDILINLTGKSVDCRYDEKNKKEIYLSRIQSTKVLQKAIELSKKPPKVWLNSSSATIYIHAETILMDEYTGIIGDDFSMNICKAWEKAFFENPTHLTRKVALRTSIVLGNSGGAFPKMKLITKIGLGGKQGNGNQNMSWIHIEDFCKAIMFIIENQKIEGFVNITAPNPIKNHHFMKQLRQKLNIPIGISSPVFLLEFMSIFLQTETELLLKSRNVFPKKLIDNGFHFEYAQLSNAFNNLIK
jgi:uncharacterized protein (TIGR01777 family)